MVLKFAPKVRLCFTSQWTTVTLLSCTDNYLCSIWNVISFTSFSFGYCFLPSLHPWITQALWEEDVAHTRVWTCGPELLAPLYSDVGLTSLNKDNPVSTSNSRFIFTLNLILCHSAIKATLRLDVNVKANVCEMTFQRRIFITFCVHRLIQSNQI